MGCARAIGLSRLPQRHRPNVIFLLQFTTVQRQLRAGANCFCVVFAVFRCISGLKEADYNAFCLFLFVFRRI